MMIQAAVEAVDKAQSEDRTRGFEELGNPWKGVWISGSPLNMMKYDEICEVACLYLNI